MIKLKKIDLIYLFKIRVERCIKCGKLIIIRGFSLYNDDYYRSQGSEIHNWCKKCSMKHHKTEVSGTYFLDKPKCYYEGLPVFEVKEGFTSQYTKHIWNLKDYIRFTVIVIYFTLYLTWFTLSFLFIEPKSIIDSIVIGIIVFAIFTPFNYFFNTYRRKKKRENIRGDKVE